MVWAKPVMVMWHLTIQLFEIPIFLKVDSGMRLMEALSWRKARFSYIPFTCAITSKGMLGGKATHRSASMKVTALESSLIIHGTNPSMAIHASWWTPAMVKMALVISSLAANGKPKPSKKALKFVLLTSALIDRVWEGRDSGGWVARDVFCNLITRSHVNLAF